MRDSRWAVIGLWAAWAGAGAWAQAPGALPDYRPQPAGAEVVRICGTDLNGLVEGWENGFRRYQPGIRFVNRCPSSDAAIAGLLAGAADVAANGREPVLTERLAFEETFGYRMTEIAVATGSYDVKGRTWGIVIFVNRRNPLSRLTLRQLDGIFGAARTGGYDDIVWSPEAGRDASADRRKWGDLGLTGKWADRPIHTYGYAYTGMTNFFQLRVLHGGDKWNPNYREYVEAGTKMVAPGPQGALGSSERMLAELSADPDGIGWTGIAQARNFPELKALALADHDGGPYVAPSRQSFRDRTYPLVRTVYFQLNRAPHQALAPGLREFLNFVLSRQGQQIVEQQGEYLPLTASVVRDMRARL